MPQFRLLNPDEVPLLEEFLYLAIHQADPAVPVPRSVLDEPKVAAYIKDWGQADDHCMVAVEGDDVVAAVWARICRGDVTGYGHFDDATPELCISVLPGHRGQGVGEGLLVALLAHLRERGYAQVSLSVQASNRAHHLYRRLGFTVVSQDGSDLLMLKLLAVPA